MFSNADDDVTQVELKTFEQKKGDFVTSVETDRKLARKKANDE